MHICLCLFACICAHEYLCKDFRFYKNTCCITFALLQEKALVLLLINTSLAKVTVWEGLLECACLCMFVSVYVHVYVYVFLTGIHWDNIN